MEDLQSRRLEALSAHITGLEAALAALDAEGSFDSLRRITRSLARAADDLALPELAALAREVRARADDEIGPATRGLLDYMAARKPPAHDEVQHVLVVEDNVTIATLVAAWLREDKRVLHLATTAAQAEDLLAAHPIDLLILDLILPDRDGRDLLLQLREDPVTASVPVIVLSARAGPGTRAECLAVGASEFLEKPAEPDVLRRAVLRLLRERRRGDDALEDPTTGTLSRAGLVQAYRAMRAHSGKVEGPLAVAVLGVQPYDQILSTLGREAGDALMAAVSAHLRAALQPTDKLGRWSEAEILTLHPGTSTGDAKRRLEKGFSSLLASGDFTGLRERGIDVFFTWGVAVADSGADLREAAFEAEQSLRPARLEGAQVTLEPERDEPLATPRVLLVEDDRVTATLIQHRLVREGFDVMDFLNGEDAFRWASDSSFDLAILDVKVPGMDGFEILERLRSLPLHAEVPIVMLTGLGSEADVVRGLELGANDYMLKPFSPAELLARVRRLLAEARGLRSAGHPARSGARA